jgi:hypothetical protein
VIGGIVLHYDDERSRSKKWEGIVAVGGGSDGDGEASYFGSRHRESSG